MYLIKVRERKVTIPNKSPVNYAASVLQISPVFLQNFFIHSSSSDPSSMRDIFSAGVSLLQISFYCHLQIFFDCEKLYSKLFYFILNRINEVLGRDDSLVKNRIFISDGLGFENLPRHSNSLEQVNFSHLLLFIFYFLLIFVKLCRNYVHDLQQQSFILKKIIEPQAEYKKEKLDWNFKDFGLNCQPTIDLIENVSYDFYYI